MRITLRPTSPEDQDFLFTLYAGTRQEELAPFGWRPEQQEMFLRMQFSAQQRWYGEAYGQASHHIILLDEKPIGRIMVMREDKGNRLVDIALLPEYHNQGIGTELLNDLISESEKAGVPIRLQVLRSNIKALHLYERLGFSKTGEDQMYIQMERKPS